MRGYGGRVVPLTVGLMLALAGCVLLPASRTSESPPSDAGPAVPGRVPRPTPGRTSSNAQAASVPRPVPDPRSMAGTSAWRLTEPAMDHEIEGYARLKGAKAGGRLRLMVSTSAKRFRAYAYRIGGYRGGDGRLVWSSRRTRGQEQPDPEVTPETRAVVAGWSASLSVSTAGWAPGFYLVKLVASTGEEALVPFTVTSPSARGRVALVAPTMTWQAYNTWGGYNLYGSSGVYKGDAVSFDRPYEAPGANEFLYNVLGTVVLGEQLGIPLAYVSDVDVATTPELLDGASGYVSLGHDEYWTVPERRNVAKARDSGTNLAFLSSNSVYWRVRLEPSDSGPDRIVVGYKETASPTPRRPPRAGATPRSPTRRTR